MIVSEIHTKLNDPKSWILTKFRNGVRIFERISSQPKISLEAIIKNITKILIILIMIFGIFKIPNDYMAMIAS